MLYTITGPFLDKKLESWVCLYQMRCRCDYLAVYLVANKALYPACQNTT
jgi:hypothetical protein